MLELDLRPYPGKLFVCFQQKNLLSSHLSKIHNDPNPLYGLNKGAYVLTYRDKNEPFFYIWFRRKMKSNEDFAALLGHEVLHVVFKCLKNAGLKLTEQTQEAYTYMLQHLMLEVLEYRTTFS